jgi:hypothetical protein
MTFSQGSWRASLGSAVVRDPPYCNPVSGFPRSSRTISVKSADRHGPKPLVP